MEDPDASNPYLLARRARIRENEQKLQELGLHNAGPGTRDARRQLLLTPVVEKKLERSVDVVAAVSIVDEPRRSKRARKEPALFSVDFAEEWASAHSSQRRGRSADGVLVGDADTAFLDDDGEMHARERRVRAAVKERAPADAGTARAESIVVDDFMRAHLGKRMAGPPTKEAVVWQLAGGRKVRFSKYGGALEWRNAVVLWVNVGGADYANLFLEGGAKMTWFASESSHLGTPVIRKLLLLAPETQSARLSSAPQRQETQEAAPAVLLFCRLPGEQYVCCGRLSYVEHDETKHPLRFVWGLRDSAILNESAHFQQLMEIAQRSKT